MAIEQKFGIQFKTVSVSSLDCFRLTQVFPELTEKKREDKQPSEMDFGGVHHVYSRRFASSI